MLVAHNQIASTTMAGRLEQAGTAENLYRRPAKLFVAGIIGSAAMNLLARPLVEETVSIGPVIVRVADGDTVTVGLRPETLRFADHGLQARISVAAPMGREVLHQVKTSVGATYVLDTVHEVRHRDGASVDFAGGRAGLRSVLRPDAAL